VSEASEVFALDIGTRTVIGLIGTVMKNSLKIRAAEVEEHDNRAMIDGQIHNIAEVAELVVKIKKRLEEKCNCSLKRVSVAAAGRALRTCRGTAEQDCSIFNQLTRDDVIALEIQAVQSALKKVVEEQGNNKDSVYHCVGYSVVRYLLDGSPIGSLVGQRASKAAVEIIATFLPRVVVDSLYAVLDAANLELESLTLEPIAASHVVIPEGMRKLNLALLDIGAGTTDIAVSSSGTIIGYGMVPSAGDEMTEAICSKYLVDFSVGEKIKRSLAPGKKVTFQDVLGFTHEIPSEEVADCYTPVINELAQKVKEKIISINGKMPQAIICIGGGSLAFGFSGNFAKALDFPHEKVAVRGREVLQHVIGGKKLQGPQAITPIGIAIASQTNRALEYCKVHVNGRPVTIFKSNSFTVADALLSCGLSFAEIYGKPGRGIAVEVNGEIRFIRGGGGEPAQVYVNGSKATLESSINYGDKIEVVPGKIGREAQARVKDVVGDLKNKTVTINGEKITLKPVVKVNGKTVNENQWLSDKDRISVKKFDTCQDVIDYLGKSRYQLSKVLINGRPAEFNSIINDGDEIELIEMEENDNEISVVINGESYKISSLGNTGRPIFSDVFSLINFKTRPPTKNSKLIMKVNGSPAKFTQQLKEGDRIVLKWE